MILDVGSLRLPPLTGLGVADLAVFVVVGLYALDGVRRGFGAGAVGLMGTVATVALAFQVYQPVSDVIRERLPSVSGVPLPPKVANAAGYAAVMLVAQVAFFVFGRAVVPALKPVRRLRGPVAPVGRILGAIPGAAHGALIAALVLVPIHLLPILPAISETIDRSPVASTISTAAMALAPQVESVLRYRPDDGVLINSRVINADADLRIPAHVELQPDPGAETEMLRLLNAERTRRGLRPLVADERLREVARKHSEEMLRLGYFSHTSPRTGSPADRYRAGWIMYLTSGENLAFAQTVELAHNGLMASPGHRRNMLAPEFSRVGIGVIGAGPYGRMFTQNFAG